MLAPGLGVVEGVGEAHAFDRRLRHAANLVGRANAQTFEHSRNHVYGMRVLRADFAFRLKALRPMNDERVTDAAAIGLAFPPLERRVAGVRPASCDMVEVF